MMKKYTGIFLWCVLLVASAGCPQRPPTREMAEARAAIESAKDAGAPSLAPEEFRSAEQMLAEASAYLEGKKYDDARSSAVTSKKLAEVARDKALKRRSPGEGGPGEEGGPSETGPGMMPGQASVTGKGSLGEGVTIKELEPVHFGFDDYSLSGEAKDILRVNAGWLEKNGDVRVQIEGHCDERGSAEYNLALGERRAKSARNYIIQLGIEPGRLSIISYGKERPFDPGRTEDAWAKNRRDEFVVLSR